MTVLHRTGLKDETAGGTRRPFKWKQSLKDKRCWRLTLRVRPWWSLLQPRGDICASGVYGPDAPDGPCKLQQDMNIRRRSCGQRNIQSSRFY